MKRLPNEQLKWYKHLVSTLETIETNKHIASINEAICLLIDSLIKQGFQKFTTGRDYYYTLKVFSSWCRESKVNLVSQLSKNLLLDFFEQAKNKKKYSSYFFKELKVCIRKLLQFLFSKGLLKENLANELKIPTKMQTKEYIPLSSSDLEKLANAPFVAMRHYCGPWKNLYNFFIIRDLSILRLLIGTGIRSSEVTSISLNDLDLEAKTITIHCKGNQFYIKPQRVIFIDTPAILIPLKRYLEIRPQGPNNSLYTNPHNIPLRPPSITRIVKKYARIAKINFRVYPHLLRHTYCSMLAQRGVDPYSTQALMGHRKAETTLHFYTHLTHDEIKDDWLQSNPFS